LSGRDIMFIKDEFHILQEQELKYLRIRIFLYHVFYLSCFLFFYYLSIPLYIFLIISRNHNFLKSLESQNYQQLKSDLPLLNRSCGLFFNDKSITIQVKKNRYFHRNQKVIMFKPSLFKKIIILNGCYLEIGFFCKRVVPFSNIKIITKTERVYGRKEKISDANNIIQNRRYLHMTKSGNRDMRYRNNPLMISYDYDLVRITLCSKEKNNLSFLVSNFKIAMELREKYPRGEIDSMDDDFYYYEFDDETPSQYQKESIPFRQKTQKLDPKIKRINAMQQIPYQIHYCSQNGYEYWNYQFNFYNQAKFMEDFTDNYDLVAETSGYENSYHDLNINQLRTYFTWRTKVRSQHVEKTDPVYVKIYLSELINLIGVKSREEAWDLLIAFWKEYRLYEEDKWLDNLMSRIVFDFVACYQVPYDYDQVLRFLPIDIKDEILKTHQEKLEIYQEKYQHKLNYFNNLSSYKIMKSKFYNPETAYLIDSLIPYVFASLTDYFSRYNLSFQELAIGKMETNNYYDLFRGLIYYEKRANLNTVCRFNDLLTYKHCSNGWQVMSFTKSAFANKLMGIILKAIEVRLREKTNYKRPIKVDVTIFDDNLYVDQNLRHALKNPEFLKIINNVVDKYLQEKQMEIRRQQQQRKKDEIIIDQTKFAEIRASSQRVQQKLVIEEEVEEEKPVEITVIPEQKSEIEMGFGPFVNSLTKDEKEYILMILNATNRKSLVDNLKVKNLLPQVMLEAINNKALDYIGDNLIEDDGIDIQIYEEYIEELKEELEMK